MTNACGVGTREVQRALQAGTSGLRQNDFEPAAKLATWIGRVDAVDESPHAGSVCSLRLPQQPAGASGARAGWIRGRSAPRRAALWSRSRRRIPRHHHVGHPRHRTRLPRDRPAGGAAPTPRCPRTSTDAVTVCSRRRSSCARISVFTAPRRRFPQPVRRAPRCSRWLRGPSLPAIATLPLSAAWIRSRCPRCSASNRWNCCRAIPASHVPSIATEFRSVKRRALRFSIRGAAAAVRFAGAGESSDAHHMSSPHPDGAGAATAMRSALADANLARGSTSTTFTCTARRAGRTTPPKTARYSRCSAPARR